MVIFWGKKHMQGWYHNHTAAKDWQAVTKEVDKFAGENLSIIEETPTTPSTPEEAKKLLAQMYAIMDWDQEEQQALLASNHRQGCIWMKKVATSDQYLQHEVLKNPFLSWRQLSALLGGIPIMQLWKAAYWASINRQIVLQKLFLTSKNQHKHLEWAKASGSTDWRGVLFMDKAAVEVGYRPRHTWVWAGIAYNLKTLLIVLPLAPRKKRPGSANQWDPAENLTAVRYCNWNIDGLLWDAVTAVSAYPDGLLVVKDGSSCHQAAICKQRQAKYNIKTQEHLLALPDLNPIEKYA
ncbi:hypothetical protein NDA13_001582 [Ustilago tritici]|nr:hypothetical protein NDA13_001582 [Ustilago tritici]